MKGSNVKNCIFYPKRTQRKPMFYFPENKKGDCVVNLNGYVIMPKKKWKKLLKEAGKDVPVL